MNLYPAWSGNVDRRTALVCTSVKADPASGSVMATAFNSAVALDLLDGLTSYHLLSREEPVLIFPKIHQKRSFLFDPDGLSP